MNPKLPIKPDQPKTFDAIAFKRQAQARIQREIKGMTPDEEIAHFRNAAATGPLGTFWQRLAPSASPSNPAVAKTPDRRRSA